MPSLLRSLGNKAEKPAEPYLARRNGRVRGWEVAPVAVRTYGFEKTADSEEKRPYRRIYAVTKLCMRQQTYQWVCTINF